MELVDKYYCTHCQEYVFASSLDVLATRLNNHNKTKHPLDFSEWTAGTVVLSAMYTGPGVPELTPEQDDVIGTVLAARPESTGGAEWGNAKRPPCITESEKLWLAKGGVAWDSK